jgi:hypothetical protein
MTTQTPRPGEIWRHYKGTKHCSVLGIATEAKSLEAQGVLMLAVARFTDTLKPIRIWRNPDGALRVVSVIGDYPAPTPLVVYACSGGLWVRPLTEFCEKFSLVVFEKETP